MKPAAPTFPGTFDRAPGSKQKKSMTYRLTDLDEAPIDARFIVYKRDLLWLADAAAEGPPFLFQRFQNYATTL